MPVYKVLCTKKIAPLLVQEAWKDGIEIIEKEFITITSVISAVKYKEIQALIDKNIRHIVFTSANAAAIFCNYVAEHNYSLPPGLNVFSLAGKTKQQLDSCFNETAIAGIANNASELADLIVGREIQHILFCCGNKRRNELPDKLRAHGIEVNEVVLYETEEVSFPPLDIDPDGILFFSPSAVSSYFASNKTGPDTVCFAIGNTTAAIIKKHTTNSVIISDLPDEKRMMDSVKFYFQHI